MKGQFDHFLITRFNLRSNKKGWSSETNDSISTNSDWLDHRINLFKNYCLPSVKNQSCLNFKWLIYFDEETPSAQRNSILQLVKEYAFIEPKFVDGYSVFETQYKEDIVKQSSSEYIISSRLDNDDVLHKDYVLKIQGCFTAQKFMAVNCIKTYHYKIHPPTKLFVNYRFSNQFISLIERINNNKIEGCYSRGDRFWNVKGEIIQLKEEVLCMEIIHEKNLINNLNGFPVFRTQNLENYSIFDKANSRSIRDYLLVWKMSWIKFLKYKLGRYI